MIESARLPPADVAEIIRAQFPIVRPSVVSYLGEGYDSWAYDVDDRWVFRFPKRDDVERQLQTELRLLPVLAPLSPLPLPTFVFHGKPSAAFPRYFGGYAKLRGVPGNGLDPASVPFVRWAPILGRFLSWLHTYPLDELAKLLVPEQNAANLLEEIQSDAVGDFDYVARVAPAAPLDLWRSYIVDAPGVSPRASMGVSLVHNDLAGEHVLCDTTTRAIAGVIDWSDVAIGDPAIDIAGLYHWGGPAFVDVALGAYSRRVDEATLARARYVAACRGVGDVTFGVKMHRHEYVDAGIRALMLCAG